MRKLFMVLLFLISLASFSEDYFLKIGDSVSLTGDTIYCGSSHESKMECHDFPGFPPVCGYNCQNFPGSSPVCAK